MVRSCYRTKMRFFTDSNLETGVVWYFSSPLAKPLPFPTRFGSGNWASEKDGWTGTGEVPGLPRPWRDGSMPGFLLGEKFCGEESALREGVPISEFALRPQTIAGAPVCCVGLPGLVQGGKALLVKVEGSYLGVGGENPVIDLGIGVIGVGGELTP